MTAVDHAELKRVEDEDCETCDGAGEVEAVIRASGGSDYIPCPDCVSRALNAQNAALLSEIEGLKAERAETEKRTSEYFVAMREAQTNSAVYKHDKLEAERQLADLRTQAPDSWRPDREAVDATLKLATEGADKAGCDGWRSQEKCRQIVQLLTKALRPQTAES